MIERENDESPFHARLQWCRNRYLKCVTTQTGIHYIALKSRHKRTAATVRRTWRRTCTPNPRRELPRSVTPRHCRVSPAVVMIITTTTAYFVRRETRNARRVFVLPRHHLCRRRIQEERPGRKLFVTELKSTNKTRLSRSMTDGCKNMTGTTTRRE